LPRWPGDTEPGFVQYLCAELSKTHVVHILAPHCPGALRQETIECDGNTIAVHRFRYILPRWESLAYDGGILMRLRRNPLRMLLVPFFLAAEFLSIARLQRHHKFAVIHAHWIIPQGLLAILYTKLWRNAPPVLVTSHGGDLFALRGILLSRVKSWVLRNAAHVTVVSNVMRAQCESLGCDPESITVGSMGVDLARSFTPGDRTQERNGIMFVGRLVEKKGVEYLVRAMSILAKSYPDIRLTIVGDGPDRSSLEALADKLDVGDHIRFTGSIPNDELPEYFRKARIAVMPSIVAASGDQEGLGLVAVEAMGCGCAVVASDLLAVRDAVINGKTGLMATPADPDDLAQKIATFLEDPALCERLAQNGRSYAEQHFDWPVVGESYSELLRRIGG
jgi:glycosyltransferase involved in cell wall biosynthesis